MNKLYYPYKPECYAEIRIILFLPNNKIQDTIILSHPNLSFNHHSLLQIFLKSNKEFTKYIKLKINKYTLIYELSIKMAKYNVCTFVNCSYEELESGFIVIPNSIKINQIENIFNFSYFFDSFSFPIDTTIVDFNNNPICLQIKDNKDLYRYLNEIKSSKENAKIKKI